MLKIVVMFLLLSVIGGTNAPLVKGALRDFSPSILVFLRFSLASLILLPFVLKEKPKFKKDSFKLLLLASLAMGINVILFAIGLQYTSIMMSQLIYIPKGLFVALLGYIFLKEILSKDQKLGLILTMIGMSTLIYGSVVTQDILSFGKPIGNLLIGTGFFASSLYYIISRKISKIYSPLTITFFSFLIASILSFPFALFEFKNGQILSANITTYSILNLFALVIFSSVIVYYLAQWLIKHTSTFIAALVLYMNFLIASTLGIIAFGEKLTALFAVGAIFIVFGVFIALRMPRALKKRNDTTY